MASRGINIFRFRVKSTSNDKKESKRTSKKRTSFKEHLIDFFGNTTIHGVRYLGETSRPFTEKIWWLMVFMICLACNSYLLYNNYLKWVNFPVIVSFSERTTPVWDIPFPAVTICPYVKYRATEFPEITEVLGSGVSSASNSKEIGEISLSCQRRNENLTFFQNYTDATILNTYIKYGPLKESIFRICRWKNETVDCDQTFSELLTEDGLCYTFNMLNSSDLYLKETDLSMPRHNKSLRGWDPENGYEEGDSKDMYPARSTDSGPLEAFSVYLGTKLEDHDSNCMGAQLGYKVLLHNPAEIPVTGERYFTVSPEREVLVSVTPDIIKTASTLDIYSHSKRQCYFSHELKLEYLKYYTTRNSMYECISRNVARKCGCVPAHIPRSDSHVPLCGPGKMNCVKKHANYFRTHGAAKCHNTEHKHDNREYCSCLPACFSVNYNTEIAQADILWEYQQDLYPDTQNYTGYKFSWMHIYMKETQFLTTTRNELYGNADFLAACGGLLSLFSGLSLISLIEVVYYGTLRYWNDISRHQIVPEVKEKEKKEEAEVTPEPVHLISPEN